MKEREIEKAMTLAVKKHGGLALKFVSPGMVGVPDRLLLFPQGRVAFVEVKAPGKLLRLIQIKRKRQLEGLGFLVYCLDDKKKIGELLDAIRTP